MVEPSNLVVWAMHQKMSDRSWMFSVVRLGECLLKYSSLASLTRLVSWLNASWQLHISSLCKMVSLAILNQGSLLGGEMSTGSGEGCCHLGLDECPGAGGERATGADTCSVQEAPCERLNGWDIGACPINTW